MIFLSLQDIKYIVTSYFFSKKLINSFAVKLPWISIESQTVKGLSRTLWQKPDISLSSSTINYGFGGNQLS